MLPSGDIIPIPLLLPLPPPCHDVLIFTSCTSLLAHVTDTSILTILLILRFVSCVSDFSKQLPNTSIMFSNIVQDMGYDTLQLLLTAAQDLAQGS